MKTLNGLGVLLIVGGRGVALPQRSPVLIACSG